MDKENKSKGQIKFFIFPVSDSTLEEFNVFMKEVEEEFRKRHNMRRGNDIT